MTTSKQHSSKQHSSKQRDLYVLRHAKSDWDSDAKSDFARPLAKRGKKDAPAMGKWMAKHNVTLDYVVSSPAERAKQTVYAVIKELGITPKKVEFNKKIYMASLPSLLQILEVAPKNANKVMLVGHNPGLDELVHYLVKNPPLAKSGKLMTTACLARIQLPDDWTQLQQYCGTLIDLTRPRDIT